MILDIISWVITVLMALALVVLAITMIQTWLIKRNLRYYNRRLKAIVSESDVSDETKQAFYNLIDLETRKGWW